MLISVKGARALEEAGARKAADLVRRAEDLAGYAAEVQLRNIVRTALIECGTIDFLIAMGKVDDARAAYQVFLVLKDAELPVPRFTPIAQALIREARYSIGNRVWGCGLYYSVTTLMKIPFWKVEYLRSIVPLQRHDRVWFRRCMLTLILKNADTPFLRKVCNVRNVFTKQEHTRFLKDQRIVYVS